MIMDVRSSSIEYSIMQIWVSDCLHLQHQLNWTIECIHQQSLSDETEKVGVMIRPSSRTELRFLSRKNRKNKVQVLLGFEKTHNTIENRASQELTITASMLLLQWHIDRKYLLYWDTNRKNRKTFCTKSTRG